MQVTTLSAAFKMLLKGAMSLRLVERIGVWTQRRRDAQGHDTHSFIIVFVLVSGSVLGKAFILKYQ